MKSAEEWQKTNLERGDECLSLSEYRAIQADALLHAAKIHMDHMPSEHWACQKAILAEAGRIEKGNQAA